MPHIKIAIAEDQLYVRKGFISIIKEFKDMELIIEAENGKDLLTKMENKLPDVVLMDLKMPELDGSKTTKILKEKYPQVKVVILTMYEEERFILDALEMGANAYLLKGVEPLELKNTIWGVMENDYYFDDRVNKALLNKIVKHKQIKIRFKQAVELSKRELEVLELICKEYSTAEIAQKLFLAPKTVEGHREGIREKIGAKNTAGMVLYAIQHNLVHFD